MALGDRDDRTDVQGLRAVALAVGEGVKLADGQAFDEVVALVKELGRLATHSRHHVDADEGIGEERLDEFYLLPEQRRVVAAPHQLEHLVAARLQRNVEVRGKVPALRGQPPEQVVGQEVGLDASDAVTLNALHLVEGPTEVVECLARASSEVANIDSGQHDFLAALTDHLAGLFDELADVRIAASSARHRDGAVRAEVVAAVLHLEEMPCAVVGRAAGMESVDFLKARAHHLRFGLLGEVAEPGREVFALVLVAHDEVDALDRRGQFAGADLRIAARDDNESRRVLLDEFAYLLPALGRRLLRDGARVDDEQVGARMALSLPVRRVVGRVVRRPDALEAHLLQAERQRRTFGEVEPATQCAVCNRLVLVHICYI